MKVFSVRQVEVGCKGDATAVVGRTKLVGSITVDKDGDFEARNNNGKTVFKVSGHIGRNKAGGEFRYSGRDQGPERRPADVRQRQAVLGRAPAELTRAASPTRRPGAARAPRWGA